MMRRMFLLYEVVLHLVFIATLPLFLVIGFLRGKYLENFRERLGFYSHHAAKHDLWIHAVSVGEVMAARTIADALLRVRPETSMVVTTTTITGQQTARRLFKGATVTYFPFDFTRSVRRFLTRHAPSSLLLVETEIWPNVSRLASEQNMPIVLANGRLSDRSFPRYRRFAVLLRRVLRLYAHFLVREEIDRERFIAIGAPVDRVTVAGNVKFDHAVDEHPLEISDELRELAAGRPIVVFGSTVMGEDELLLPLWERLIAQGAFLVVAPRKPERFEFVAGLLAGSNVRFSRRSEWSARVACDVVLLDTIGELARVYSLARAAFVGGSLLPGTGGHNPIEPAAVGVPVAFGPHMSNFREIAAAFLTAGAARQVDDVEALEAFVRSMLDDAEEQEALASSARRVIERNRGAAQRIAQQVAERLP